MRKVPIPFSQRLVDFLRGPVALFVWLGAAGSACMLLLHRPVEVTHVAWVPPVLAQVTAPADGRIEVLSVEPSQLVARGDVLGRLDDELLTARLATEQARVEELRARVASAEAEAADDLERAIQDLELTRADETRRFAGDLRRYRGDEADLALDVLALEVKVARDTVEIERVAVQLTRARSIAEDGIGPRADVEDLDLRRQQVEAGLERTRALLARTRVERDAAAARLTTFLAQAPVEVQAYVPTDTLAGIRAAVSVQERALAEVVVALGRLQLVAPLDGQIHELYLGDGQNVRAGDPIVRIVGLDAREAVLFLDPASAGDDLLGRAVELSRFGQPGVTLESTVASIAPHVELMPERLWLAPDLPRYGRAARVPLGQGRKFLPGEVLGVRVLE